MKKYTISLLLFCSFLLINTSSFAESFLIKPYVFSILGRQIAVSWEYAPTGLPSKNPVLSLYKHRQLLRDIPATLDEGVYSAILPIPPCGFGDDLSYKVDGQDKPNVLNPIPCSDYRGAVKFTFLADAQEGTSYDAQFAKIMSSFPGSGILNGGDFVETGSNLNDWRGYFKSMEAVGGSRVLFPGAGNHEYRNDKKAPLWRKFFKTPIHDEHYAFDMGAARVIVLNSNFVDDPSLKTSQEQLEWLEGELKVPSRWKIVFFHHPGYSVGYFNGPLARRKEYVTIQDYYIPLFEKYKVDLVLNGHVHLFETSVKSGIHYLIVGPAGGKMGIYGAIDPYRLKSKATRSIINLEVAPDHLRAVSTGIDGSSLDDLILKK